MIRILLNINYQMHRCQISYIFRIFHNESSFLRPIDKIRFTKQLEQDKKGSNLHSQAGNVKIKIIVETFNIENFSQVSKDRDRVFPTIFFKHAAFSESAIRRRSSFQATYFPVETWQGNKNARIEGYVCVCVCECAVEAMANDSRGQNRRRMGSEKGAAKNQ